MQVFVKAFSRPFYLDRCLTSIRGNVDGYDEIVVLDDGLPPECRHRLEQSHPDVRFERAPWADIKGFVVRNWLRLPCLAEKAREAKAGVIGTAAEYFERMLYFPFEMDPLAFWRDRISASSQRFMLLIEEDCWITHHIDLAEVERLMTEQEILVTHLFLHGKKVFGKCQGDYPVGEEATLEVMDVPWPPDPTKSDTYLPVSLAVYDRAFWLHCHAGVETWIPEEPMHAHAVDYLTNLAETGATAGFARITPEPLAHGFSLSSTVPATHYGQKINLLDVTDAITQAWLDNEFDSMSNFPQDFDEHRFATIIQKAFDQETATGWIKFRRFFSTVYESLNNPS